MVNKVQADFIAYAKATKFGYKVVKSADAEAVVVAIKKYKEIECSLAEKDARIADLNKKVAELKEELDDQFNEMLAEKIDDVKDAKKQGIAKYRALEAKFQALLAELDKTCQEKRTFEEESKRLARLNDNLLRIARERANAKNGQDKKDGTGYYVTSSAEYVDNSIDDSNPDKPEKVWKTSMRTYYDASIPFDQVRKEIRKELIDKILGKMGISVLQEYSLNGVFNIWTDPVTNEILNGVYKISHRANFREGVWEIDLYHNLPIIVPAELLPPAPAAGNTEKGKKRGFQK